MAKSTGRKPSKPATALAKVRQLESAGDFLEAHERAMKALKRRRADPALRFRAVLTLARSGTIVDALRLYRRLRLGTVLQEDERSLRGRLLKDGALGLSGDARRRRLRRAAGYYAEAHQFGQGAFSAINAATLYFFAGEAEASAAWRERALASCRDAPASDDNLSRYWNEVTCAEAALLAGDGALATDRLQRATALPRDVAAWASTRRQLATILAEQRRDDALLAPLALPTAIHFAGHMIAPPGKAGRFRAEQEHAVKARIAERLQHHDAGFLCGSLACGADILFAEAAVERNAELHLVLPFAKDDFVRLSVPPGGRQWKKRFETCLKRATSVTYATDAGHDGDDTLFAYASRIAMGQAIPIAQRIGGRALQLAVWDGVSAGDPAGTAFDVTTWRAHGGETDVIAIEGKPRERKDAPTRTATETPSRTIRAILFGDVKGFSKLADDRVPAFERDVLGACAEAIEPFAKSLRYRNTWGDALFLAFDDLADAARAALALQERFAALPEFRLRLGGHLGPTYEGFDPLRRERTIIGAHVTRAARLEPVTPPGAIYVTEPFAAALALTPPYGVTVTYVGRHPAAKGYGELRMYRLDARRGSPF